jgi:hypothetical protein
LPLLLLLPLSVFRRHPERSEGPPHWLLSLSLSLPLPLPLPLPLLLPLPLPFCRHPAGDLLFAITVALTFALPDEQGALALGLSLHSHEPRRTCSTINKGHAPAKPQSREHPWHL